MPHRRPYSRLVKRIEQVSELRALLVLAVLLSLRLHRQVVNRLRGILTPERRRANVYVLEERRQTRPLRPVDLLLPIMFAQTMLFAYAMTLPASQAIYHAGLGSLILAGVAMLPSVRSVRYRE
jgi:hypothetical protein